MEWSEEQIERLRELWDQKPTLSTAQIGLRLGMSKNAVVGKAHRLRLPGRVSPIRYTSEPRPTQPRAPRATGPTLPLLTCLNGSAPSLEPRKPYVPKILHPEAPMARPTAATGVKVGPVCKCRWPFGDPKTKGFRFCDEPSEPSKSYCFDHMKLAYVKLRDLRDEAA